MAKKLYVRFSTSADEKKIFDFYADNKHAFVVARDAELWKERIASGAVTLIEDAQGKIVASSISYPIVVKDKNGEEAHRWTEIGSTRVALEGIGLFNTLISAQVLRAYMLEPPDDRFVLEIVAQNAHSKHVFVKAGATPFELPRDALQKVQGTIKQDIPDHIEWFQLGAEAMPGFAQKFLAAAGSPKVVHKQSGEEYELDFSKCALMTVFDKEVRRIAGLNLGNPVQPDLKRGMGSFKKKV